MSSAARSNFSPRKGSTTWTATGPAASGLSRKKPAGPKASVRSAKNHSLSVSSTGSLNWQTGRNRSIPPPLPFSTTLFPFPRCWEEYWGSVHLQKRWRGIWARDWPLRLRIRRLLHASAEEPGGFLPCSPRQFAECGKERSSVKVDMTENSARSGSLKKMNFEVARFLGPFLGEKPRRRHKNPAMTSESTSLTCPLTLFKLSFFVTCLQNSVIHS